MHIHSITSASAAEKPTARAIRNDDNGTAASFAGLLASVLGGQPEAPTSVAQADGTSELDAADAQSADAADGTADAAASSASPDATAAAGASPPIVRSTAALDPALQAKLARVISRVEQETGHTVGIEETYRSQARQNALFAQGRDTAGPVVTWTQNSKHTQGRAVDVTLDGGAAGADAYRALQRIAQQEGLRTLGARDPGHLELPGAANGAASSTRQTPSLDGLTEPADASRSGTIAAASGAPVARVATVADVAQVASTARVAQVAQTARVAEPAKSGTGGGADSGAQSGSDSKNGYAMFGTHYAARTGDGTVADPQSVAAPASNAAANVEKVMAALDSAPARHLSQITMSVDAGNGTTDRVHVAMRGDSLSSTIDTADPRAAQAMTTHSGELSRALGRDGIELESLRVRAAANPTATGATVNASPAQTSSDPQQQSSFHRGDAWQQRQDQQDQQDRRDAQQQRRQQRQQRGGNTP